MKKSQSIKKKSQKVVGPKEKKKMVESRGFYFKKISWKNFFESLKKDRLKLILFSLLLVVLVSSVVVLCTLIAYTNSVVSMMEINATINVSDYVGLNAGTDQLYFGAVYPGGSSLRELTMSSEKEGYVYIVADKKFNEWIYVSEQNVHISEGEYLPLKIRARVPSSAAPGNYAFKVRFFILERKANFVSRMFFGKNEVNLEEVDVPVESGKVAINIVNSSVADNNVKVNLD